MFTRKIKSYLFLILCSNYLLGQFEDEKEPRTYLFGLIKFDTESAYEKGAWSDKWIHAREFAEPVTIIPIELRYGIGFSGKTQGSATSFNQQSVADASGLIKYDEVDEGVNQEFKNLWGSSLELDIGLVNIPHFLMKTSWINVMTGFTYRSNQRFLGSEVPYESWADANANWSEKKYFSPSTKEYLLTNHFQYQPFNHWYFNFRYSYGLATAQFYQTNQDEGLWDDSPTGTGTSMATGVGIRFILDPGKTNQFSLGVDFRYSYTKLKNINDCYVTLGIFHNKYSMIPGKFKDYISTPKINQYKSIHTSVIGPLKKRIEIQIRTESMHEFAERGIASHWKYKSSEKFSELSWKEYDWLKDLVEIMETGGSPEHYFEFTKLQMFQDNVFCFTPKGAVIKLPKGGTPVDFAYAVHTKVGDTAIACEVNGKSSALQTTLRNGDMVKIITSKKVSPSLHWLSSSKTGKARASIRKHWQDRLLENESKIKEYTSTLSIDLPHKPGILGKVSTLIGLNDANIINIELTKRSKDYLQFLFDIKIKDLKNFTNLISQLKQQNLKFKVIRHKKKKYAFIQRVLKNFKRN